VILVIAVFMSGCEALQQFWDKEFVAVYTPGSLREKQKTRMAGTLNYWLGRSKDERTRIIGPPQECVSFNKTEELCEWRIARGGGSASAPETHSFTYTYNQDHLARAWTYRGDYGQFTSAEYPVKPP
jgi:hypothetical protein